MADDEVVRWQSRLRGHEREQTLGDSGEQASLVCCSQSGTQLSNRTATTT